MIFTFLKNIITITFFNEFVSTINEKNIILILDETHKL